MLPEAVVEVSEYLECNTQATCDYANSAHCVEHIVFPLSGIKGVCQFTHYDGHHWNYTSCYHSANCADCKEDLVLLCQVLEELGNLDHIRLLLLFLFLLMAI